MLSLGQRFIFLVKIVGIGILGTVAVEGSENVTVLKKSERRIPDKMQVSLDLGYF